MKQFVASRLRSLGYAFHGWGYVLRSQPNIWLHVVISAAVIGVSIWVGLGPLEWAVIVLTMAIVFAAEFLNTAIEAVVDLASPHRHPLARVGKDVGAGAVLIAALAAVVVGILVLGPPICARLRPLIGLP